MARGPISALLNYAADIKLAHSVFALPFVGVGLLVSPIWVVTWSKALLILLCMVSARSFAMGMNRLLDVEFDRLNLRTSLRALPAGRVTIKTYIIISAVCAIIFVMSSFQLSIIAGALSIPVLVILASYSLMKRVSWATHWYLGLCLGLAPIAAEIALVNHGTLPVLFVGIAVAFWTAGFDLLYSLQDREFDVKSNLHSFPAAFGHRKALVASMVSFAMMIFCLGVVGRLSGAGRIFDVGVIIVSIILAYEHWIVRMAWKEGYSKKINSVFFTYNAFLSVLFFLFALADRLFNGNI